MKILHPSGHPYDLFPGTDLELTRYNPFFNELGEQSIPISLPGSPRNMALLGHPGRSDNNIKPLSRIDAVIQSGAFHAKARQAILSATQNSTIETSFYLNEGAFYEQIGDITLHDIFATEKVQFANVTSAATFVFSLMSASDNRMSCFMVNGGDRIINMPDPLRNGKFYYHVDREETIEEKQVIIPAGMYITPFVKVKYVLQKVVEYLGYTLSPSFMDLPPFNDMVFLNNNADTILSGSINYVDIVPEISIAELFDLLRKFNCEIIPDEIEKTVKILNFDSIIDAQASEDLTRQGVGELTISYHNDYRQLVLISDVLHLPNDNELARPTAEESTTLTDLSRKYPSAKIDTDGSIYRIGYKGERVVKDRIGSLHMSYNAGDDMPVEERRFPDVLVEVTKSVNYWQPAPGGAFTLFDVLYPYVGAARHIRTKLVFTQEEEQEAQQELINTTARQTLRPMLCLYYYDSVNQINIGTIHNYSLTGVKLWNYTLAYNGEDGVYEKFWRKYDEMLRNALLEVRGEFILTETQKLILPSHAKVIVDSQAMIVHQINYVPGRRIPAECRFFSTKPQAPLSIAKTMDQYFLPSAYKWELVTERNFNNPLPSLSWEVIKYANDPLVYFPEPPTAAQYNSGGRYYEKQFYVEYGFATALSYVKQGDGIITTYLQAVLSD